MSRRPPNRSRPLPAAILVLGMLLVVLLAGCTEATDPPAVQTIGANPQPPAKLGLCVACHGEDGRSRIPAAPHIAGQNPIYLVWALNQYKAGKREGDVMNGVVGALNERDIEQLARWYASQPCTGVANP